MKTLRITLIYGVRHQNNQGEYYFKPGEVSRKVTDMLTSTLDRTEAHQALDSLLDEIAVEESRRETRVRFT